MIAFSTASAPELNNAVDLAWVPGVRSLRASATATYCSYGVTMKHVWVKRADCSAMAAVTAG